MIKILEILPFVVFLALIRDMDRSIAQNWETPFIVSGLVAVISILGVFYQKKIFNRVLLGLNLYLLTGGIALIGHQWWLNRLYGRFQGSGMLACLISFGFQGNPLLSEVIPFTGLFVIQAWLKSRLIAK